MKVLLQNSVPQIKTVHMVNVVTQMFVQDLAVCVYHIIIAVIDTIPAKEQVMVSVIPAALENIVSQIDCGGQSLREWCRNGVCVKDQCHYHFDYEKQEHSCCKKQFLNESSEC